MEIVILGSSREERDLGNEISIVLLKACETFLIFFKSHRVVAVKSRALAIHWCSDRQFIWFSSRNDQGVFVLLNVYHAPVFIRTDPTTVLVFLLRFCWQGLTNRRLYGFELCWWFFDLHLRNLWLLFIELDSHEEIFVFVNIVENFRFFYLQVKVFRITMITFRPDYFIFTGKRVLII